MGISRNSTDQEIKRKFKEISERIENAMIMGMQRLGEEMLNYTKSIPAAIGYTDRTGALRSSTGYLLLVNGEIVKANFERVEGPEATEIDGTKIGRAFADKIAKQFNEGFVLVFVAGMDYALAVESKGRDVLTSTEIMANSKVPEELLKLKEMVKVMKI